MENVSACTSTMSFDAKKLEDHSSLMLAARELMANIEHCDFNLPLLALPITRLSERILIWLSEDKETNSNLLEAYTILSSRHIGDDVFIDSSFLRSTPEHAFECEINELTSSLNRLDTLVKSPETLELARQVAQIDTGDESISAWATLLACDISKAKD